MQYILVIVCFFYLIWKFWLQKKPGPEPPEQSGKYPIIGHALQFINKNYYKIIVEISEECLKKGGIMRGRLGIKYYAITDPEIFYTVSNNCLEKEYFYDFFKPFFGEGLFTGKSSTWKRHRKLLNPIFNQQVLNSFVETFNNKARALVDQLQLGKPFDHEPFIRENNFDLMCHTVLGDDDISESSLQLKNLILSLMSSGLQIVSQRMVKVWLHLDFIFNWFDLKKKQDICTSKFWIVVNTIIQKRKSEMEYKHKENTVTKTMKSFLELTLDMANTKQCLTGEEINEEMRTLILAAYETTPSALNLSLMVLGSYPDVQEKVYNEIIQVCGGLDQEIDKDDLSKLVYTEAVLKETLRLYPVGPVIARRLDKDVKLKNYTLKRGSSCLLLIYGLNRHPVWGPDANEFKPERWLDTATLPDMKSFGSFGIGKRNCIGRVYAMMSMKITLAHVLRAYRVSADITKLVINWQSTVHFESGHHYTIERR